VHSAIFLHKKERPKILQLGVLPPRAAKSKERMVGKESARANKEAERKEAGREGRKNQVIGIPERESICCPDADFTPNPDRAIWVRGEFNGALLDRLRPEIHALTSSSREPITVFIDSNGGAPAIGESILNLLKTNQDGASACCVLAVGLSKAYSAAADLLVSADVAIVLPQTKLIFHGAGPRPLRANDAPPRHLPDAVLRKWTRLFGEFKSTSSETSAAERALHSVHRFLFIMLMMQPGFQQHRVEAGDLTMTDLECLQQVLDQKVSPGGQDVLKNATTIWRSRSGLVTRFEEQLSALRPCSESVEIEKLMLNLCLESEFESRTTVWSLRSGGLARVVDHFIYLDAYFQGAHGVQFGKICHRWAPVFLSKDEQEEKFRAHFLPFWSFFMAICRAVEIGDNELSARDGFFLGLIDVLRPDLAALLTS
jgi:hypothetical protein